MASLQSNLSALGLPISPGDQLSRLLQRGMSISSHNEAIHFLSNVSLYRFRSYLEPFVDQTANGTPRPFQAGTTFDGVLERYRFDARLRVLLLEAFNHIEISMRTQWTYHLSYSHGGGEYSHLNPDLFSDQYSENLEALKKDYEKHGKDSHHYDFNTCPTWAISEVMSFGQLSRWYRSTIPSVRQLVAAQYQLHHRVVRSLLHHLAFVRNFCAHHELLWDRTIVSPFRLPTRMGAFPDPMAFFNETETGKLYNTLVMIAYLTEVITGNSDWKRDLIALMDRYPNIPRDRMGFVAAWQKLDIWQV